MGIRKEQLVLVFSLVILGWFVYGDIGSVPPAPRGGGSGDSVEFVSSVVPDVSLALAEEGRTGKFERDLFAPPRDTSRPAPRWIRIP